MDIRWKVYASAYPVGDILSPEEKQQLGDLETDEAKRAKTIARREEVYQATQQELTRIHPYESVVCFFSGGVIIIRMAIL